MWGLSLSAALAHIPALPLGVPTPKVSVHPTATGLCVTPLLSTALGHPGPAGHRSIADLLKKKNRDVFPRL